MDLAHRRSPATRGVFAIADPALLLPRTLALDTSFVVRALIETERLHLSSRAFLERLIESETTVVTSELLPIELAEASFGIALKERWGKRWRHHRADGRARRKARRLLTDVNARYESLLESVTHTPIPLASVTDEATAVMADYGLASYDAVHAVTAISAGAEAIVTTDTSFASLPVSALHIYTDRSRLTACRAKRPR